MMRFLFLTLTFIGFASATSLSEAQIDPSSAMLLNSSQRSGPVRDGGLDSGRYTVKPRTDVIHRDDRQVTKPRLNELKTVETKSTVETKVTTPTVAPANNTATDSADHETTNSEYELAGETHADTDLTQSQPAETRDYRRIRMLELTFAPGYLYNESRSTFSPRNYFLNAPVMTVDASVWVAANFGLRTSFTGTVNANVTDSYDNSRHATASDQWFTVGARTRKFFGETAAAPTLQFGLDYREFEFRVPADSQLRNKLATSGVFATLEAETASTGYGSYFFGVEIGPRLHHRETSNGLAFKTGDEVVTTTVGAHLGGRYRFDHTQSLYWKLSYHAEKNQFSGSTSIADPITGQSQSNVSVTNSVSMFQLGYTWSD